MKKKYVQKMLTMVLTAAMICSSVPVTAETISENETAVTVDTAVEQETAEETDEAGIEADQVIMSETKVEDGKVGDLTYSIYQLMDGTQYARITGCDRNVEGTIEIPKEVKGIAVTRIEAFSFSGCSGLTSITIPADVTNIGYPAFENCSGLTNITVETGNMIYDSRDDCNAIIETKTNTLIQGCKNTKIPTNVTSIGMNAFSNCSGLTSIEIPAGVTEIGSWAFSGCSGLTSITIPAGVTSIGYSAFSGCSGLTSIEIPKGVTSIEDSTFSGCSGLTSITIPAGVTSIGYSAFSGCSGLTRITIPAGVTSIGEYAFEECSMLTGVTIPKSVTSVGEAAFEYCSGLTSIAVEAGNAMYDSRDNSNALIETKTNTLILGCKSTKIPSSVTSIGESAFSGCDGLTSIEIPASVTSIGEFAFWGCSGLTSITVEAGNAMYDSRDNSNALIETKTNTLILGCKSTKIPSSVTSIGESAFEDCSGLTSIEIPSSVTSMGNYAFRDCIGLKDVYYTGTQEQWNAISFGNGGDASDVFVIYDEDLDENISIPYTLHCNSSGPAPSASPSPKPSEKPSAAPSQKPSATPSVSPSPKPSATPSAAPSTTPSVAPSAVPSKTPETDAPAAGTKLKEKTGREFKVTESDGSESKPSVTITKLSAKDKKAKKVTIPKTVTVENVKYQVTGIAAKAFKNSKKLQTVVIPDTVTEIGASSFEGCQRLKSVTIGKNVTSIGKNAFKNCKNLKKVTVKSTKLKKVGKGALTGINAKCVIKVPKKQLKSYKSLFKGKGQEKTVKITK